MNKFKNILIITLSLGMVLVSLIGWLFYRQRKKAEVISADSQKKVKEAVAIIDRYVDSSGRQHVLVKADENVLPHDWFINGTAIRGGLIDTVAAALKIARKQLQQVSQIALTSEARALKAEKKVDSLQRITFFYKGKNMQISYRPPPAGSDTSDQGQFDYRYNDSLNVVQYWKRNWFLGTKKSYIDIFSSDPYTTVNGVKRMVVQQKEPVFGLRIQAVGNYSFSRQLLNLGPGVQFDIHRFSLIGTYYYDFQSRQFRLALGARYDLIRF